MAPESKTPATDAAQIPTGSDPGMNAAQQEEFQRLMKLPLSQIKNLPQEQQELFWLGSWQETLRQIADTPNFLEALKRELESVRDELSPFFQQMAEIARAKAAAAATEESIRKHWQQIAAGLHPFSISAEIWKMFQEMATLAPYMKAEIEEHPEKYADEQTGAHELIAAAARRALEDGKDTPFLKAEEQTRAREMIAAAARRALEDDKDAPFLKVEEPGQEQLRFDFPADKEETRLKRIKETRKRRELARQQGALLIPETRLATIADKEIGFDYFTREVLKKLPKEIGERAINQETGQIDLYDITQGKYPIEDVLKEVDGLHTAFLMWLLKLARDNSDLRENNSNESPTIPVYLPDILKAMNIDPRPRERDQETKELIKRNAEQGPTMAQLRRDKFMEFLSPLHNVAAFLGRDLYQIAGFDRYEEESETIYIRAPYMFKLVEYVKLHMKKHGAIRDIFHADIMTENQTAVELANRIAMGLIARGVTRPDSATYSNKNPREPIKRKVTKTAPDGAKTITEETFALEPDQPATRDPKSRQFSYTAKFSSLIEDCPELKKELDEIRSGQGEEERKARQEGKEEAEIKAARQRDHKNDSQRANKKLQDVFTAAIRIIMEKSDIPKYYKTLTIKTANFTTFKAPTNSTLNTRLVITHKGKNPDFTG